ncbi:MAG: LPS export ABC transporter permease LptG [Xanthomonadaceae bacterium]|nr:LPS export ABC transporter permease LptG [Xanthomonadaceae bacterium]
MRLLDRYIASEFLRGMLPVLLLLGGLLSFLALAEELDNVGKGSFGTLSAVRVTMLTMPRILIDILPVMALMAALIGLGRMANSREIVAFRAAGVPPWRMAVPLLAVALTLIALVHLGRSQLIPGWERQVLQLRAATVDQVRIDGDQTEYWTRTDDQLVRVGEVLYGRIPTDLEIYRLDRDHRLTSILLARRADAIDDGHWLLHDVIVHDLSALQSEPVHLSQLTWANTFTPAQLASLIQPAYTLAPADLKGYIGSLQANSLNTHQYRFVYWQMLSLPVALLAMTLLALPFVLGSPRSVPVGQRVALGGGIGLVFYLFEQVIGHLAVLYRLDPIALAMAPDVGILLIAIWAIWRRS